MVSVAVLATPVVLPAAVNPTPPLPVPLAPLVIVTHDALLVAVQGHPGAAVTDTTPVPPAAAKAWLEGAIVGAQLEAACVMV
jgi:hypothetical protein